MNGAQGFSSIPSALATLGVLVIVLACVAIWFAIQFAQSRRMRAVRNGGSDPNAPSGGRGQATGPRGAKAEAQGHGKAAADDPCGQMLVRDAPGADRPVDTVPEEPGTDPALLTLLFDVYQAVPEHESTLRARIEEQLTLRGGGLFRPGDLYAWEPDRHEAVREVLTALPERDGRVAWAEGPGLRMAVDGEVLRRAQVARYRYS